MTARRMIAALLLAALAGCTSDGDSSLQRIGQLASVSIFGEEERAPQPELTRAELDQIPYATIALSFEGGPRTFLVPLADNGGYLSYMDEGRHGLVMKGGAVTGTLGLGQDLKAVTHHISDPIAVAMPLEQWPGMVYRDYQFRQRDLGQYSVTMACVFQPLASERIEIVEIAFDVVRVAETCTNAARKVANTYWVEPDTGFIWKSEQWLGPHLPEATVEIIRPYSG